jgi:signal transduction histidine kinase
MTLRVRLSVTFALVALLTGLAVAVAAPAIVGRGFARLQPDATVPGGGGGGGGGQGSGGQGAGGAGQGPGAHAQQVQQETTATIVAVAFLAAASASVLGFLIAGRIAAPLRRLEEAAGAVAAGELDRRSGLGGRRDEIGSLGRSFDAMAGDLQASEASRRRFFQDAAHEMKTPLAVIEATATAVLDGVYAPDPDHLETIRGQSRLLARIVDDLRTISLAESGRLPLRRTPVEVESLVGDALRTFGARLQLAGVAAAAEVDEGLVVRGDPERLGEVLGVFLDNALRYVPRGGRVMVAARASESGSARLSVTDTGPGVPGEALSGVFDRFYQADEARDRASGTSGLGLSIARALVEAQGGRIGAENVPDGGARFWVELPLA